MPKDQTTPTATTVRHTLTTARFLKNKKSNRAVTAMAAPIKYPNSPLTLLVIEIRMNGSPLRCVWMPVSAAHRSEASMMSSTMRPRLGELSMSRLNTTIINVASLLGL